MSKNRAPYEDAFENWRDEVIAAARSETTDSFDKLFARWLAAGYKPDHIVRCMLLPYIVLELSEPERMRLAKAARELEQRLQP